MFRIHYVGETVAVFGESLKQIEAVAQHEDCESSAQWFAARELQQLLTRRRLVVDFHVE